MDTKKWTRRADAAADMCGKLVARMWDSIERGDSRDAAEAITQLELIQAARNKAERLAEMEDK